MLDEIAARHTLCAAFERVRENAGCRGANGVTVGELAANLEAELGSLQGLQWVAREEVSCKAVENEKQGRLSGRVVKRPNLSACRLSGLERSPLELP